MADRKIGKFVLIFELPIFFGEFDLFAAMVFAVFAAVSSLHGECVARGRHAGFWFCVHVSIRTKAFVRNFFGHGQTGVCLFVFGVLCLFWGLGSPCGFSWDPLLRVVPVCLIVFYWNCNLACGLVLRAGMPADCVCAEILLYLWFYAGFYRDVRRLRKRSRIGYYFWFGRVGDVTGIGFPGFMGTMCHNTVGSVSTQFMGIIYHERMGSGSHFDMGIIGYDNKQKKKVT